MKVLFGRVDLYSDYPLIDFVFFSRSSFAVYFVSYYVYMSFRKIHFFRKTGVK